MEDFRCTYGATASRRSLDIAGRCTVRLGSFAAERSGAVLGYIFNLKTTYRGLFLPDLDLDDVARMLDDLGDIRFVPGSDFSEDTLVEEYDSTSKPVLPEDTDLILCVRLLCQRPIIDSVF